MEKKEDKKAKFLRVYANVPENLRGDIIAVIDKKPYTWNTSFLEINDNTELGRKILKALEEIRIL
ncbi:MAG: hypothetical protein KKE50_00300 [Nanoarchaeota archaeon]|nr:hypothetical protein [Nanoarchaeota archaeon]